MDVSCYGGGELYAQITDVMRSAGIRVVPCAVPCGIMGQFNFSYSNYYYVVTGKVPLYVARELYADPIGKRDVRVDGHCGCPPPEAPWVSWYTKDGREVSDLRNKAEIEKLVQSNDSFLQKIATDLQQKIACYTDTPEQDGHVGFVETYHIDSAAGLLVFCNFLRKHGLDK